MKKKQNNKRGYEKPAIIFEEKIEALAGACGALKTEKSGLLQPNPNYGTACKTIHS